MRGERAERGAAMTVRVDLIVRSNDHTKFGCNRIQNAFPRIAEDSGPFEHPIQSESICHSYCAARAKLKCHLQIHDTKELLATQIKIG
jgi:hypothetical protein